MSRLPVSPAPLAVIFGDLDKIASPKSTSSINRRVRSAYFVWRPVKDNSHLELTMGYDLAQICEDVRDLVVMTTGEYPCSGRYLTNLSTRWTPAPPIGGKK